MSWMVVATGLTRATTFAAQILLGWWLVPRDFALYATATSVAGFMMVCRDMATGHLLVQRGKQRYEASAGPAFWLAQTYNCLVALVMIVAAYPLATVVYHDAQLAPMLWVMAASLLFSAVGNTLFARLRIDLAFRRFGTQNIWSGLVRQGSMVLLAKLGFGSMSFAWPLLACSLFDTVSLCWMTRDLPWRRPAAVSQWPAMIRQSVWLMVNSLANFAMDFGPYLVLGPILLATLGDQKAAYNVTGFYFFAYQITAQIGVMLAFNAVVVLVPALQRMAGEPTRQREAAMRALRTLMLAGSISSMGLAVVMGPLQHLLWGEKYAQSVPAVLVFGVFYPWRITFGLCTSVLLAQGAFRRLAALSFFECAGLMAFSAVGGVYSPTATGIALWTGGWVLLSRLVGTWYVFHKMGGRWWHTVFAMVSSWTISLAAFGAALWTDGRININGLVNGNAALGRLVASVVGPDRQAAWISRAGDIAQIVVAGGLCAGVFGVLARLLLASDLRDMLQVAPARLRAPLERVLRLKAPV